MICLQRAVELMKDGKLVVDANTGLLVNTDDSDHPTQGTIGEAPTLLFTNYLHSPYEPVSIYMYIHCYVCTYVLH